MGLAEQGVVALFFVLLVAETGVAEESVGDRERCLRARRAQRAGSRDERRAPRLSVASRLLGERRPRCARIRERGAGSWRGQCDAHDDCGDSPHGVLLALGCYSWWAELELPEIAAIPVATCAVSLALTRARANAPVPRLARDRV